MLNFEGSKTLKIFLTEHYPSPEGEGTKLGSAPLALWARGWG